MREIYNDLFYYGSGSEWNVSACHLKIALRADQHIVIATEVFYPVNRGVSVTWGAEALATQVVKQFNLDPEKTLFIEHWPQIPTQSPLDEEYEPYKEKWDRVEFTWKKQFWEKTLYASDPHWTRIIHPPYPH